MSQLSLQPLSKVLMDSLRSLPSIGAFVAILRDEQVLQPCMTLTVSINAILYMYTCVMGGLA